MPLLVCLSVCLCMCNIRRFTVCENCTRPIATNPGSMEAGECGLTRGTCIIACRLELYAVAGLLWLSCFVLDGARFLLVFFFYFFSYFFSYFFFLFFFFERTRPAASMRPPCLIYLSTSNEARTRERSDRGRFLPLGQKSSSYRGAYRVPLFN